MNSAHLGLKIAAFTLGWVAATCHAGLCENGRHQSPINITPQSTLAPKLPAMQANYLTAPLRLANDGHTLRVRFDKGSEIVLGKERFALQQFHFHTPAGDQINAEKFPFGAHILHKNASGQLLAITVPFRIGSENQLLGTLLDLIPARVDGDHKYPNTKINARALLPPNLDYYRYSGSLTDAPCTEGVEWLVMKQALELSAAQLDVWRKHFTDNMRAVNPLHQRKVQESLPS